MGQIPSLPIHSLSFSSLSFPFLPVLPFPTFSLLLLSFFPSLFHSLPPFSPFPIPVSLLNGDRGFMKLFRTVSYSGVRVIARPPRLARPMNFFWRLDITFLSEFLQSQINNVIGPMEVRPLLQILDTPLVLYYVHLNFELSFKFGNIIKA
jgi:hypothetical protein